MLVVIKENQRLAKINGALENSSATGLCKKWVKERKVDRWSCKLATQFVRQLRLFRRLWCFSQIYKKVKENDSLEWNVDLCGLDIYPIYPNIERVLIPVDDGSPGADDLFRASIGLHCSVRLHIPLSVVCLKQIGHFFVCCKKCTLQHSANPLSVPSPLSSLSFSSSQVTL